LHATVELSEVIPDIFKSFASPNIDSTAPLALQEVPKQDTEQFDKYNRLIEMLVAWFMSNKPPVAKQLVVLQDRMKLRAVASSKTSRSDVNLFNSTPPLTLHEQMFGVHSPVLQCI